MSIYERGKIYSIRSYQTDEIYIGSTCNDLCKRIAQHRADYKMYLNGNFNFITSFNILKYDDHYIELVENHPCNSKEELRKREGEVIRESNCVNKHIPGRSNSEYREDHREIIAKRFKQYYRENHDKILEQKKEYGEDNREIIAKKKKEYYKKNQEIIRQKHKEIILCEICNCDVVKNHIARHNKTKKHLNNIESATP